MGSKLPIRKPGKTMIDFAIENGQFVINTAYGLIFLGVFTLARALLKEEESRAAAENLEVRDRKASNPLVKFTRPFFTQYVVPWIRGKKTWDTPRRNYKRKLVAAGLSEELTPDEFIAFKVFMIVFFPIVGGVLRAGDFLDLPTYAIFGSGIAGWF